MRRFLLDTNLLLGFTRRAAWAQWTHETYRLGDESTMVFLEPHCGRRNCKRASVLKSFLY